MLRPVDAPCTRHGASLLAASLFALLAACSTPAQEAQIDDLSGDTASLDGTAQDLNTDAIPSDDIKDARMPDQIDLLADLADLSTDLADVADLRDSAGDAADVSTDTLDLLTDADTFVPDLADLTGDVETSTPDTVDDTADVPLPCADQPCNILGAKSCGAGGGVVECGDYNSDGCLEWGDETACGGTLVCSSGFCATSCNNACAILHTFKCDPSNAIVTCDDHNQDGCIEWGNPQPCGDLTCVSGFCLEECKNECTSIGAKECELDAVKSCNDFNMDGCLEWSTPLNCAPGLVCLAGKCVSSCEDTCEIALSKECDEAGNVVTCDDFNDDGCIELGGPSPCDQPYVCDKGNCSMSCSDDCLILHDSQCLGGGVEGFHVCDDWDEDGCLEWGSDVGCNAWEHCVSGSCAHLPTPAQVVISEVLYDATAEDNDVYIELMGPAGTDLSSWSLVLADGATGNATATIALTGTIGASGYYLVAKSTASAGLASLADQLNALADPQNGPDNVLLKFGTNTVDALGYGEFTSGLFFLGEGSPAVDVAAGHSLSRDSEGTDTSDNSVDFLDTALPTPGTGYVVPNQAPNAALACPSSGTVGVAVSLDAGNSTDADGTITNYAFAFGDGESASGTASSRSHTYSAAGDQSASVTVTDNQGLSDSATCVISITDGSGPTVAIVKPANNKQVTQGSVVQVTVDAEAAPGRSVSKVELLVDGVPNGAADTQPPYEFTYTVPAAQPTGSTVALVAKATDNASATGLSPAVNLLVKNDFPIPSFTAVVSGALKVTLDASSSFDTETSLADLEVRWDFENDGTWDTAFSATKVLDHVYLADGTYTVNMELRDKANQVASTTRQVVLSSIQYVGGNVTTTTWTGTIVVTGDITVPSGNTLTIAPCTSVLFAWNDQNSDSIGDWGILVQGTLLVQGTEACPVLFTSLGTAHKAPRAWDGIHLQGSGHLIDWAIFEYADLALDVRSSGTMNDTIVRQSYNGLNANTGSNLGVNRSSFVGNTKVGATLAAGVLTLDECHLDSNGTDGLYVSGGTLTLTDSLLQSNGNCGLHYFGAGSGIVNRNLITGNAWEGVRVETNGSSDPSPVIQFNNIYGNATVAARVVVDVNLSVWQNSAGTVVSALWSSPLGEIIDWIAYNYSESDSGYYTGYLTGGSTGGTQLLSLSYSGSGWQYTQPNQVSKFRVEVQSGTYSSSYYATMSASKVAYNKVGEVREMSVLTKSHRLDARHNYFGLFPNVLSVVTVGNTDRANVEGFIGIPFDDTWSKGIYYGGEVLSTDTTWLGDVIITGQLDVVGTIALTIGAGVNVRFACVDSNNNSIGDCDLEIQNAQLNVQGTSSEPVTFTDWNSPALAKAWSRVLAYGSGGTNLAYATFEYGNVGLELRSGTHLLDHVRTQHNGSHGLLISTATSVASTGLVSEYNGGEGVLIEDSSGVTLNKAPGQVMTVRQNTGHGVHFYNSNTSITLSNASITQNTGSGIHVYGSKPSIDHCTVSYNSYGVFYEGNAAGTLGSSNVKFNDHEGIFLLTNGSNPSPAIHGNNLYANSVESAGSFVNPGLSIYQNTAGTAVSAPWSTPDSEVIEYIRVVYSESDSGYYYGAVYQDNGSGSQLYNTSYSAGPVFRNISDSLATAIVVAVQSGTYSSSYYATMSVTLAFFHKDSSGGYVKELAAVTDGGTVSCTDNYWGLGLDQLGDIPTRLELGRPDAVDYSAYVGIEKSGTGPQ